VKRTVGYLVIAFMSHPDASVGYEVCVAPVGRYGSRVRLAAKHDCHDVLGDFRLLHGAQVGEHRHCHPPVRREHEL
jgi:hypothetical protein